MSGNTPFQALDSDVSPALLPLASQQAVAVSVASSVSASSWNTGDYKVSAQAADHADGSGMWLLCDGTAVPSQWTNLIATVGANRPDARGRALVMLGTNASVNALLANEGAAVANRRPHHRHSHSLAISGGSHTHNITYVNGGTNLGNPGGSDQPFVTTATYATQAATHTHPNGEFSGTIGSSGSDPLDAPAFIVPGSLFIHT